MIDAVLGTGFHPPLRGVAAALKNKLAGHPAPVVSVDLPTGWDADSTAMSAPDAFRSDAVITFTAPKLAHVFGALTRGPVAVAQIGSPADLAVSKAGLHWTGASKKIIEQPRALDSNKGRFGHVLVVGGSPGKGGAAAMASLASMRAGAGLTTAAIPRSIASIVAGFAPELMTLLLEESSSGSIAISNIDPAKMEKMLKGITTLAIGLGLGREPETAEFIRALVLHSTVPTVLDADGLNAFEGRTHLLDGSKCPLILTPHPGEMARLLGSTIADVERDRLATARTFATEHKLTLVLKGWRTLVAHPDGAVAVNTSGNPAMAKGGSGDILTGIVAAMVAQFPKRIQQAVECAVWLHGASADLFAREQDEHTMLASEMLQHLSQAIQTPVDQDNFTWFRRDSGERVKSEQDENVRVFTTHSAEETIQVGRELARFLDPPKVLLLRGDLGAGKTTLVKGIAAALSAAEPEEVTSPTFTLIHEYAGRSVEHAKFGETILLYHLDLYSIENQRQLDTLGMEELMTPQSVLLIEWGEKFPSVTARSNGEIIIETLHERPSAGNHAGACYMRQKHSSS